MIAPKLPEDFKLPLVLTNQPELHSYESFAIKTADFDGEGRGFRIAVCMDLIPESVAAYLVHAANAHTELVTRLNAAQQMLMGVACQPSDSIPEQLRANLRAEALAAVETLRKVHV